MFFPITLFGVSSSTDFSDAVFKVNASRLIFIPGAIDPPRYSLFLLTTSKVVAVPRSITTVSVSVMRYPATELAILSGPSSFGLSILTFNPVLIPGPTITGSKFKYLRIASLKLFVACGTTEQMIAPSISFLTSLLI